ncbi:MAG: GTPase, partial [Planctomycetota bacterium]
IEAEARLAMRKSATLLGVSILQVQIDGGLSQWAAQTLAAIDSLDREEIRKQCRKILDRGKTAQHIIEGVRIVIAGAPNSGKSTLLNCLAGAGAGDRLEHRRNHTRLGERYGPS